MEKTVVGEEAALVRLLRAIAEADKAIVRERDRGRLLKAICRVVVEHGGFRMAWIGLLDEPTRAVRPVAVAGHDEGYVAHVGVVLDGSPRGYGPTGRAIREQRTQVCDDMATDPLFAPWREAALARGYRSSGVFPLLAREKPSGTLNVYSAEPGTFRGETLALLEELTANLAFGLDALAAENGRREAEEKVRRASAYLRSLLETSLDPLVAIGLEGAITDVNRATEEATGLPRADLIGTGFCSVFTDPEKAYAGCRKVHEEGEVRDWALSIRHVTGRTTDVLLNASLYRNEIGEVQGVFAAARVWPARVSSPALP